jgi:hypothetical protein
MGGSGAAAKTLSQRERVPAEQAGEGMRRLSLALNFQARIPSSVAFGDTFFLWEKGGA